MCVVLKDLGNLWSQQGSSGEEGETGISGRGLVNKGHHMKCSNPVCCVLVGDTHTSAEIQGIWFNTVQYRV